MSESESRVLTRSTGAAQTLRELLVLTKPRITLMVVITAAGGMWLAPGSADLVTIIVALASLALVVAGANTLNCWLERDTDKLMKRTASRPLPAERIAPTPALVSGVLLGGISVPLLALFVNPLTAWLGALSLVLYVGVYTPMKQLSPAALLVGAVPGAMPPLMGWTAVTGTIDAPGLVLFFVLFFWQLPHFIAIASFRREEYERAGLKVLPSVRGDRVARVHALAWALLLLPTSVLLLPLGVAGYVYTAVATVLGVCYLATTVVWLRAKENDVKAPKRVFLASLLYLPFVFAVLMLDSGV